MKGNNAMRYARAVFQLALERGDLDRWQSDLTALAILGKNAELLALFENPRLHFEDKTRLLAGQLGDINPLARNLIHLLLSKDSLGIISHIAEHYRQLLNDYRGIAEAEVITAVPLDDEDKQRLAERLGDIVDRKVVVRLVTDPGLIGGFVARVSGKLIDGSTRGRLEALKKELSRVSK
ncbi:MAG: F0F1 ATP synthase subunit delta [Dehalococcoidales bacterium]|nr:F0F1 ATP synthase subunit delta [Dehalococcoidales bacterium]